MCAFQGFMHSSFWASPVFHTKSPLQHSFACLSKQVCTGSLWQHCVVCFTCVCVCLYFIGFASCAITAVDCCFSINHSKMISVQVISRCLNHPSWVSYGPKVFQDVIMSPRWWNLWLETLFFACHFNLHQCSCGCIASIRRRKAKWRRLTKKPNNSNQPFRKSWKDNDLSKPVGEKEHKKGGKRQ